MKTNEPTLDEWRRLYAAMQRVAELAPWEWMEEIDVFGVQDPETKETGFVSVMGQLGEHFAVSVYLGARGLDGLWTMEEHADTFPPEMLLEIPQLQASLENRGDMEKKDLDTIKVLGLKFRGAQAWPQFRAFHPGYLPWHLEAAEARFLTVALEQLLEMAPRFQENPDLFDTPDDADYLVRVPVQKGGALVWLDQVTAVPPYEAPDIRIPYDPAMLAAVKGLPQVKNILEMDFFNAPMPIGERGARPFLPFVLLVVEASTGFILGTDIFKPEPSLEEMWGSVPQKVLEVLLQNEIVPQEIAVHPGFLESVMGVLAHELNIKIKPMKKLKQLERAKRELFKRLEGF